MRNTQQTPEKIQETINWAVELASLLGEYLVGFNPSDFRQKDELERTLIRSLKKGNKKISDNVSKQLKSTLSDTKWWKNDSTVLDDEIPDIKSFLEKNIPSSVIARIKTLFSDPDIRKYYFQELQKRKDTFDELKKWQQLSKKVLKIDKFLDDAEEEILKIRINAFKQRRKLKPSEVGQIDTIRKLIKPYQQQKSDLLHNKNIAIAYRLHNLENYRKQNNATWFIITPTIKKKINKILEHLLLGKSVLLAGATWWGKTKLAEQAVLSMVHKLWLASDTMDGRSLAEEMADPERKKLFEEFIRVISWHAGITASEFIQKTILKDGNTQSQLGKLLKAFVDGTIPIIDEIDMIPGDVLFRIKHLFSLRAGQQYSPQEDSGQRHTLQTTNIIATANIKSEKHPDRQEMDSAIIRLFEWLEVGYLPKEEIYDIALANLMEPWGYLYKVGTKNVASKESVLGALVLSLKEIEDSYLGKWDGSGLESAIGKRNIYLSKAVLELGKFIWLFQWFKESGKDFLGFIKQWLIDFVSNPAYPLMDRSLLIRILGTKWLLTQQDIPSLMEANQEFSPDSLKKILTTTSHNFPQDTINFIDPYQLANLDPFKVRNFDQLITKSPKELIKSKLQEINQSLIAKADDKYENLIIILEKIADQWEITQDDIIACFNEVQNNLKEEDIFKDLWDLGWLRSNEAKKRIADFIEKNPNIIDKYDTIKSSETLWDIESQLINYQITTQNQRVNLYKTTGEMIEEDSGDKIQTHLKEEEKKAISMLQESDITDIQIHPKQLLSWEKYHILIYLKQGEQYTAIHIPESIKNMKYKETHEVQQYTKFKDQERYPAFLTDEKLDSSLDKDWLIQKSAPTYNADVTPHVNINLYNNWNIKWDIIREVAKKWWRMMTITDNIIMTELIKQTFGEEYLTLDFCWQNFDPASIDPEQKKLQQQLKEIEDTFLVHYPVNQKENKWYLNRDYSFYKQQKPRDRTVWDKTIKENYAGFLRGSFNSDFSAMGGVASVDLNWNLVSSSSVLGFRPCG